MKTRRNINNVVIVNALRTPIGKVPGKLSHLKDVDLMSFIFKEALKSTFVNTNEIEGVYV